MISTSSHHGVDYIDTYILAHYINAVCVLDVSDCYFQHLMRLMTSNAFIYTEMLNCNAVIKNHK